MSAPAAAAAPKADEAPKKSGFLCCFGSSARYEAAPVASAKPSVAKTSATKKTPEEAMQEIARRSAMLSRVSANTNNSVRSKNSDLMGDLTDDFHKLKENAEKAKANMDKPAEPKAEEKKAGEVWD